MLFSWDARHAEIERLARSTIITDDGMRRLMVTLEELLALQGFDVQQPYAVRDTPLTVPDGSNRRLLR